MTDYRAYFVGREKHFIGYRGFVCQDDGEAIEKAKELLVWCSVRHPDHRSKVKVRPPQLAASFILDEWLSCLPHARRPWWRTFRQEERSI
jgi:hypothetical protein